MGEASPERVSGHAGTGAFARPSCPSHPCPLRETRALQCRSRVRSSLVSWDSPPVVTWLHRTPKSLWLIEVDPHRGGSISFPPVKGHCECNDPFFFLTRAGHSCLACSL